MLWNSWLRCSHDSSSDPLIRTLERFSIDSSSKTMTGGWDSHLLIPGWDSWFEDHETSKCLNESRTQWVTHMIRGQSFTYCSPEVMCDVWMSHELNVWSRHELHEWHTSCHVRCLNESRPKCPEESRTKRRIRGWKCHFIMRMRHESQIWLPGPRISDWGHTPRLLLVMSFLF